MNEERVNSNRNLSKGDDSPQGENNSEKNPPEGKNDI